MDASPRVINAPDLARLCSLGISTTLEEGLRDVLKSQPASRKEAITQLVNFLEAHADEDPAAAVAEYKQQIVQLECHGFSSGGCSLVFVAPDASGRMVELFPGGSRIAVRECNYSNFRALFSLFCEQERTVTEAYIEQARAYLPLSAKSILVCGEYRVILDLIEQHLLNTYSPWSVSTNSPVPIPGCTENNLWDFYGLKECVCFRGRLFSTRSDYLPPGNVGAVNIRAFVAAARRRLEQLDELETEPMLVSLADALSPNAALFLFGDGSSEYQMALLNNSVIRISVQPDLTLGCNDTLAVRIGPDKVELVPNNSSQLLRPHNVPSFVTGFLSKRVEIARVIDHFISGPAGAGNSANSAARLSICPPELSPQWNTKPLQPSDMQNPIFEKARYLQSIINDQDMRSRIEEESLRFAIARDARGEDVYRLIPGGEAIPVTAANLEEFCLRVEVEHRRVEELAVATARRAGLTNPPAQSSGFVDGLRSQMVNRPQQNGAPSSLTSLMTAQQAARAQSAPAAQAAKEPSVRVGLVPSPPAKSTHVPPSPPPIPPAPAQPNPPPPARLQMDGGNSSTGSFWLTKDDVSALDMLEVHLRSLREHHSMISRAEWATMEWTWVIRVPNANVVIPLFDGGSRLPVAYDDMDKYVDMALNALKSVREFIDETGSYPPPYGSAVVTDPIQQSRFATMNAVPETPTEKDRALFSPTHEENDLFAPIERMN